MANSPAGTTPEMRRTAQDIAAKLTGRGIEMMDSDSPDDVLLILETVEAFEQAVQASGGDLMVDEPPAGHRGQPDDPRFALPLRGANEPVMTYVARLQRATEIVRDARNGERENR